VNRIVTIKYCMPEYSNQASVESGAWNGLSWKKIGMSVMHEYTVVKGPIHQNTEPKTAWLILNRKSEG